MRYPSKKALKVPLSSFSRIMRARPVRSIHLPFWSGCGINSVNTLGKIGESLSKKMIGILGTGSYLPEAVLTNQDLEKLVNTTDAWIVERSGVHERRIAA